MLESKKIDMNGKWSFRIIGEEKWYDANVPSCNFGDLYAQNLIPDFRVGTYEEDVSWVAEKDYEYKKIFKVDISILEYDCIELNMLALDTLATVFINDKMVYSIYQGVFGRG